MERMWTTARMDMAFNLSKTTLVNSSKYLLNNLNDLFML